VTPTGAAAFDPRANYRVGDQVVLRREAFGALAYDLSTKQLRVLRDPDLVTVLERLDGSTSAVEAVATVDEDRRRTLLAALAKLEREGLIGVV
jgi:putative mycofactocin binding protein MftB